MTDLCRRVVLTGAGGRIGSAIMPLLPACWDVQRTDLEADQGIGALDVTDRDACPAAFTGADAVVHLAAVPDPAASWERLLPANVVGTTTSPGPQGTAVSAVWCWPVVCTPSLLDPITPRSGPVTRRAPANLYGATKAWAEALGWWVAATTSTSVVALRIGYFAAQRPSAETVPAREMSAWLSPRDAAELVRAAVVAEGLHFEVANGISANRHRFADL
jgi:nucleoside-diphosphate-sugar epimerase